MNKGKVMVNDIKKMENVKIRWSFGWSIQNRLPRTLPSISASMHLSNYFYQNEEKSCARLRFGAVMIKAFQVAYQTSQKVKLDGIHFTHIYQRIARVSTWNASINPLNNIWKDCLKTTQSEHQSLNTANTHEKGKLWLRLKRRRSKKKRERNQGKQQLKIV